MKESLRQQRENCLNALGNLPKNLQKSYRKKIMNAEEPMIQSSIIGYAIAALSGALVATIIFALIS